MFHYMKNISEVMSYYTAIVVFSAMVLAILGLFVYENNRLNRTVKRAFYRAYIMIILAMCAEWAGIILNGTPDVTRNLHILVKCLDYTLTPFAGYFFIAQVDRRSNLSKAMWILLILNSIFAFVSAFTGWLFYVNEQNYYYHGSFYFVYIFVYTAVLISVVRGFIVYGKNFKKQNRICLLAIIFIVCLGILVQEMSGLRTSYLSMAFASVLLYLHYNVFMLMQSEDDLSLQKRLLETDPLTGLYSRYAYTNTLHKYEHMAKLPENLVVFSIDINELKTTNDSLGHIAGDELIKGAAECIQTALGVYGMCFRTGGDEFIAFLHIGKDNIEKIERYLLKLSRSWKGTLVDHMSLSVGSAVYSEQNTLSIEQLIAVADEAMYRQKNEYYLQPGKDRRHNR